MPTPAAGYRAADGKRLPSVTTILGRWKESGALINWAWAQGRDGKNLYETRDAAANIGTQIHAMIEAHLRGQELPKPPEGMTPEDVAKARSGYDAFFRWIHDTQLEVAPVEVPLISEELRIGGTPDGIAVNRQDQLSLADWKSAKGFYPAENLMQGAAYIHLWNVNHPENPITDCFHVVRFGKDGSDFAHYSFPLDHPKMIAALRQFKRLREAYEDDRFLSGK